jgi:hypothetical protein
MSRSDVGASASDRRHPLPPDRTMRCCPDGLGCGCAPAAAAAIRNSSSQGRIEAAYGVLGVGNWRGAWGALGGTRQNSKGAPGNVRSGCSMVVVMI